MYFRFSSCNSFSREASHDFDSAHESQHTQRSIGRSTFRLVPKLHSSASVCPVVSSCKHVTWLRQAIAWLPGCLVRCAEVADESVS